MGADDQPLTSAISFALPVAPYTVRTQGSMELYELYRETLGRCFAGLAYNAYSYEPIAADSSLSEQQRILLNRLAHALMQANAEVLVTLVSQMKLTIAPGADLSRIDFDVLERIWTAVGAELGRRGENTQPPATIVEK